MTSRSELRYLGPPAMCDICGTVLHAVLVRTGMARHPCCDPDEKPWDWRDGKLRPVGQVTPMPRRRAKPARFRRPSAPPPKPVTDLALPGTETKQGDA